jgi:hypothetical protein
MMASRIDGLLQSRPRDLDMFLVRKNTVFCDIRPAYEAVQFSSTKPLLPSYRVYKSVAGCLALRMADISTGSPVG